MKVLLDECVTRYLKRDFTGHQVLTIEEAGFKGLKNGRLLQAASGKYDCFGDGRSESSISAESKNTDNSYHRTQG